MPEIRNAHLVFSPESLITPKERTCNNAWDVMTLFELFARIARKEDLSITFRDENGKNIVTLRSTDGTLRVYL